MTTVWPPPQPRGGATPARLSVRTSKSMAALPLVGREAAWQQPAAADNDPPVMVNVRFARATWGLVAFLLAVVLWGAFVRATGSGAGCGAHWPVCNGEVRPRAPALETIIELN